MAHDHPYDAPGDPSAGTPARRTAGATATVAPAPV
jgi:hypothetical protein